MPSMLDLGSLPDWISSIAAAIAVVFAGVAAWAALRTNAQQNAQLSRLEAAEVERVDLQARSQANRVAAWIILNASVEPEVHFLNASGLPIHNLTVVCVSPFGATRTPYATKSPDLQPKCLNRPTLLLRELADQNLAPQVDGATPTWPEARDEGQLRVAVSFLDSEGRWWVRDVMGKLHPSLDGTIPDDALNGRPIL